MSISEQHSYQSLFKKLHIPLIINILFLRHTTWKVERKGEGFTSDVTGIHAAPFPLTFRPSPFFKTKTTQAGMPALQYAQK